MAPQSAASREKHTKLGQTAAAQDIVCDQASSVKRPPNPPPEKLSEIRTQLLKTTCMDFMPDVSLGVVLPDTAEWPNKLLGQVSKGNQVLVEKNARILVRGDLPSGPQARDSSNGLSGPDKLFGEAERMRSAGRTEPKLSVVREILLSHGTSEYALTSKS
ncbi:hypothetical protein L207DRAFT_532378 [Hyaloscypha variabilis F]|uniref:Uncharacterized protein n=1 Tax=Hyaloscypha variabilis (strain UAMH 11265 / GT02V1 / F) TaxID=1149755 RepID=A0A2J6RE43_HYAVF|nr:hypothetical protein L207DRAFT_532378 [Hyaloscypha variabilis F]